MLHCESAGANPTLKLGVKVLPIQKLNVNISETVIARKLKFLMLEVLSRSFLVLQFKNDRAKLSPQLGFLNPKNKTSEGYSSKNKSDNNRRNRKGFSIP